MDHFHFHCNFMVTPEIHENMIKPFNSFILPQFGWHCGCLNKKLCMKWRKIIIQACFCLIKCSFHFKVHENINMCVCVATIGNKIIKIASMGRQTGQTVWIKIPQIWKFRLLSGFRCLNLWMYVWVGVT